MKDSKDVAVVYLSY